MPSEKILAAKQQRVEELAESLKGAFNLHQQACLVGSFSQGKAHFFICLKIQLIF